MPKAEISWKRVTEDGAKLQVNARRVSREWRFFQREKRFDHGNPCRNRHWRIGWRCSTRCNGSSPVGVINRTMRSTSAAGSRAFSRSENLAAILGAPPSRRQGMSKCFVAKHAGETPALPGRRGQSNLRYLRQTFSAGIPKFSAGAAWRIQPCR